MQGVSDNLIAVPAIFPVFLAEAVRCGRRETGSERKAERDREMGRECVGNEREKRKIKRQRVWGEKKEWREREEELREEKRRN